MGCQIWGRVKALEAVVLEEKVVSLVVSLSSGTAAYIHQKLEIRSSIEHYMGGKIIFTKIIILITVKGFKE